MTDTRPYLRFPHINGDDLAFTADDDVWLTTATGGRAVRLTSDRAPVARPRLSPDGTSVAWLSRRDGGHPEVYVMAIDGGPATRLTYWGLRHTRVLGWTPDGRVIASSAIGQPFATYTWAYAVPVSGEPGERLPYGPISGLALHPDGPVALQSVVFREPADWKRYRGGTAAKLWLDRDGSGRFEPFLRELNGQLADPVWLGDRLLLVSDHEGFGNIYSVAVDGSDLRRHSDHEGMYARNLAGDGTRAAYQREGDLYVVSNLDPAAEAARIEVGVPGARGGRQPFVHLGSDALGEVTTDQTGRASIVELRGTAHWLTHLDGPVPALATDPGVRIRLPRVTGGSPSTSVGATGASAAPEAGPSAGAGPARPLTRAWITDADGDDALEVLDVDAAQPRRMLSGQIGRVLDLALSPDGRRAALATHDGRVLAVELADGAVRELERNEHGDASGLCFSPDSAWLAWSAEGPEPMRNIRLASFDGSTVVDATEPRFTDTSPAFTLDGRHLAFLSARTFDPVYDVHNFELAFPVGIRPYLLPLAADTPSPFEPELAGRPLAGSEPPEGGSEQPDPALTPASAEAIPPVDRPTGAAATDTAAVGALGAGTSPVRVEADGLIERIVAVPVEAGIYRALTAAKGGLLWLATPLAGEIGDDRPVGSKKPRATLRRWDFAKRAVSDLVEGVDSYSLSGDGTRIAVRDGSELRIGPADHKVEDPAPGEVVTVDLSRLQIERDPGAEWRQMAEETWRLMRDHFWVDDMAGVDWPAVLEAYRPVVDRLATRDDLSEVLWELIAELGTSHAYERAQPGEPKAGRGAAFLGADLARQDDGRWRVERVLPGEASVPAARSPLLAAGAGVGPGAVLVAVNGRPVPPAGPGSLLAGLADKPVELTVEEDGTTRSVVVVPVPDETPLRYQAWVVKRRAYVHERSDGRVGYVHVPDMVSTGWAEFNRDLRGEIARPALVVDTRENNGGHTSQLVIERLARRVIAWGGGRHHQPTPYPQDSPRGPLVSIANEMAGSDGDIVNQAFKLMQLGLVVGTRTWGGVIGIDGRYDLVDGTVVTQPRYAFWFDEVGWGVENYGVDPDVEVPMPPQAWVAGEDPQLDAGLAEITRALETDRPLGPPDPATRPSRAPAPLPPRPGS
ncbi:MAG: S41 family peptidase [bacterium]